ncbi:MAG: nucleotidyl transferase AbiEii/AbiGii toxin family protein [Lachnospiraceae bacterium]|nr:nucleotidyl transferase AbiEii/AbiGii toxin family protein [Lachnospiraceae bacterium]
MNITAEEKLMYEVMKAVYDSGIPVNFKGSMVLKACLLEAGYTEDTRHTVDVDANWFSDTPPTGEQLTKSLQKAITDSGINLIVRLYRMYGEGRSAGFELTDGDSGEIMFTIDMDVNRPTQETKIYEVAGMHFCGVAPVHMIADKLVVVSSEKVFRRIKDVVDLYYLSRAFTFDRKSILETIRKSEKSLGSFQGFLHRSDDLRHAYEKFRFEGNVKKPPFDEVYQATKSFIRTALPE